MSVTVQGIGNRTAFDEFVFDSGTTPKGGEINISSDLDGTPDAPLLFLYGNAAFPGNAQGRYCGGPCSGSFDTNYQPFTTPYTFISIPEGKLTVSLYSPTYEIYQQTIDIETGQETLLNAIMVPAEEPNYMSPITLQSNTIDIDVGQRASPYLVDYDNDGTIDLLTGNAAGDIQLHPNNGTNNNPDYASPITILSSVDPNASPFILDYYTDNLKDLVVGYSDGSVRVFLNNGTNIVPDYSGTAFDGMIATIPSGDAVPCFVDWNNDGRKDLLVGGSNGNVYLFLNQRLDASPSYGASPAVICSVGSHAAPAAVLDWNADGLKDLIVGDADGYLNLFLNEGTDDTPVMGSSSRVQTTAAVDIDAGTFARPLVLYYNNDPRKDLIIGNGQGNIIAYKAVTGN